MVLFKVEECVLVFLWLSITCISAQNYSECESIIGCRCEELTPVTGVECSNVTDFGQWSLKLRDGRLFPINETYEIVLSNIPALPAEMLDGLIVFRLYIEGGNTATISPDVFKSVIRLRRFHVRSSLIEAMPKLSYVAHSLRNLNFDGSKLTNITNEVQHLPLLTELTFRNNSISSIAGDAFLGTTAIEILDLSNNLLESLPSEILDSLTSLKKLALSFNRLQTVQGLLKLARPRYVLLGSNNLTDADDILYNNMTQLETVDLNHNPLRRLSTKSFNMKLPDVRFLHLDYCQIEEFNVDYFANLSILAILDLTGNRITTIPNKTIAFGKSLQLILDRNRISSFVGEISYTMKRLYLNGNQMRMLGTMLQLTQLAEVEVSDNLLEGLIESDLRGVHSTENALFRNNTIARLDRNIFYTLRNDLKNLDLSYNSIKSLNGSVRYLSTLKMLNVSYNLLTTFDDAEFIGLNELSELYMQNNLILALGGQLQRIPQLRYLILKHNQIQTVPLEKLPRSLNFLYIEDNPLICDCRLMPFLEFVDSPTAILETDVSYCTKNETVEQPMPFNECVPLCSCYCTRDINDSFITVDCHGRNISMQSTTLSSNTSTTRGTTTVNPLLGLSASLYMLQNKDSRFTLVDRVLSIDLEQNYIESLEGWYPPEDLKVMRLANNSLTTLPDSILALDRVRKLTLSKNQWDCDCASVRMKRWMIAKSEGIIDFNETRCGETPQNRETSGKLISSLSDVDLCPSYVGLYISVSFGVLILLLVVASGMILYNRYELYIKIWLYSHGVSWVKQSELDKDKVFDAFLSYSQEDRDFVHYCLVSELEKRIHGIKICLHDRHFLPGEYIHNNIINAVKCSKRTVLVLSKNFLESEWCRLEFHTAHLQGLEDKIPRIVVIIVGELPKDIDPEIQAYLKSTTYVLWGDKYFWQKLIYAIPKPNKHPKLTIPLERIMA